MQKKKWHCIPICQGIISLCDDVVFYSNFIMIKIDDLGLFTISLTFAFREKHFHLFWLALLIAFLING